MRQTMKQRLTEKKADVTVGQRASAWLPCKQVFPKPLKARVQQYLAIYHPILIQHPRTPRGVRE
jgi:hypothetical protein